METSESIRPDKAEHTASTGTNRASLGAVVTYTVDDEMLLLYCEHGNVAVSSPVSEIVRLTLFSGETPDLSTSAAVAANLSNRVIKVEENEAAKIVVVNWVDASAKVNLADGTLEIQTPGGHPVSSGMHFYQTPEGETGLFGAAGTGTHYYGLGEKTSFLDKRGESYAMWNSDVFAPHVPEIEALYVSIPFLIPFDESQAYGLFLDNTGKSNFDMRQFRDAYEIHTETGGVDVYVISGPALKDVISRYTALTGRMPLPPKWAIGYHQSRYSYMTQDEVLELARTFKEKGIPLSAVHLDIHYMRDYRVFTFQRSRFPDPKSMISELLEMGVRVVPIVDPGVKQDARYAVYRDGVDGDHFCKTLEGDIYIDEVWPGLSAFPDFTNDRTAKWWGENHRFYLDLGIRGIWNDMNEPAIFNESKTMPGHVMHRNNGKPRTHEELHNVYGTLMSRATYNGLKDGLGGERPFVLTRSGYAGIQRYAAVWTGDNRSFWEHMAMAMPMVLNLGMSGVTFSGPDVGGFAHHTSGELLARWTQMGAFFPFFRNHSALDTVRQEPWSFGEEVEEIIRKYIQLRYQFLPYLYTLFKEASDTGVPVMRPLVLEYPQDRNTYNLSDEFLVGRDVLVAPIYRPDTTVRSVYLPAGVWFDYWTGKRYEGSQHILAEAPLDTLPLFIRQSAVIPMENPASPEHPLLHVYLDRAGAGTPLGSSPASSLETPGGGGTDEASNSFTLYADDGETFAYENGAYNLTQVSVSDANQTAVIQMQDLRREFSKRPYVVAVHGAGPAASVNVDEDSNEGSNQTKVKQVSIADLDHVNRGFAYDSEDGTLLVKVSSESKVLRIEVQKS